MSSPAMTSKSNENHNESFTKALESITSLKQAKEIFDDLIQCKALKVSDLETSIHKLTKSNKKEMKNPKNDKSHHLLSTCRTRAIALLLSYDGESYTGYAENVGKEQDNSIETHLFSALRKTCLISERASCNYSRCGRTDKGVSAVGQVVALRVRSKIPSDAVLGITVEEGDLPKNSYESLFVEDKTWRELNYATLLNGVLPPEIRILGWCPVTPDFSARFSAKDRTYRYFFVKRNLDVEAMQRGLDCIVGQSHDFRNLCKINVEQVTNFCRVIHSAKIVLNDPSSRGVGYFEIRGQAFLWHQIRCIVAVAILIGQRLESSDIFRSLMDVEANPGKPSYPMFSEYPLVLHKCSFHHLQIGFSCANLLGVMDVLEQRWERHILAAERAMDHINTLKKEALVSLQDLKLYITEKVQFFNKKKKGYLSIDACLQKLDRFQDSKLVSWGEVYPILMDMFPLLQQRQQNAQSSASSTPYIPLLERCRGTTYQEKIKSIKGKRKKRFEENCIKKQKSKNEDQAFYQDKLKQGGSGF